MDWQPIESAPKDREIRLGIYLNWDKEALDDEEPRIGNGFYDCGGYWYEKYTKVWRNRLAQFLRNPTHWQEMDEPPTP